MGTTTEPQDHKDGVWTCQRCSGGRRTDDAVVTCLICELELAEERCAA